MADTKESLAHRLSFMCGRLSAPGWGVYLDEGHEPEYSAELTDDLLELLHDLRMHMLGGE